MTAGQDDARAREIVRKWCDGWHGITLFKDEVSSLEAAIATAIREARDEGARAHAIRGLEHAVAIVESETTQPRIPAPGQEGNDGNPQYAAGWFACRRAVRTALYAIPAVFFDLSSAAAAPALAPPREADKS